MTNIPCDIVLLPSKELAEKAIAASQQLASLDAFFTLEFGKFFPHMSLYMFQFDTDDTPKVDELLQNIASSIEPITGSAARYDQGTGFGVGYVDAEYEATKELSSLQDAVVGAINPVRAGMREKDKAKLQDATGVKLENLQKYGYPSIGELFRPHITLSRLKEHKPEALDVLPSLDTFNGTFDRIGLFEMGDNGTCIRMIGEYPLGRKT